jgi:transposase-like protein
MTIVYGQRSDKPMHGPKPIEKIEQWEKAKLIELLNLNEENSVRFFARRNEHQNKMKDIIDQRDQFMKDLTRELQEGTKQNDNTYRDKLNNLISFDSRLMKERESFLRSLNDLLTPQQILKLSVYEIKFRKEIREKLMERGRNK